MPSTSELISSLQQLAIQPLLKPQETDAQFVIAAINREIEFRLERMTVPVSATQQNDDLKVLVCHYDIADHAGFRDSDEPLIVKFSWLGKRDGEASSVEERFYAGLATFVESYDDIMTAFDADVALIVSPADISIVAKSAEVRSSGEQAESNAWLMTTRQRIIAEAFGDVPGYAEVCRVFQDAQSAT